MRRLLLLALLLCPALVGAQDFIRYYPPASSGGGGGDLLDGTLCTDSEGFLVRTASGVCTVRALTSTDGSLTWTNPEGTAGDPSGIVDTAVFSRYSTGTASIPAAGSGGTFYVETDRPALYHYLGDDNPYWSLTLADGVGTSGGIPYFTATADLIGSSAALTANLPVIGGGAGVAPSVGTRSGNTTAFVTTTGTQTSGDCVKIDANGNHIANGSACGGSSVDPFTTIDISEDFSAWTTCDATNSPGKICGVNTFIGSFIATGTIAQTAGTATNPGFVAMSSHVSNDNSGVAVNTPNLYPTALLTTKEWHLDSVVCLGTAGDITADALWVGLSNTGASITTASSGIWIRRDTDPGDTAFVFAVCDSATTGCQSAGDDTNQKTVLSTITPADGSCYRFRIDNDFTGPGSTEKISMRVNDETAKTFCSSTCDDDLTQLPAASMIPVVAYITRTTTGVRTYSLDYFRWQVLGISGRY